ncbi:DELTA-sagatoxin-Srs1a-like [Cololabis saira]|uniref:DELTA-sagatoxin-Srs1a-like n=1 Tax=Cololabis saira TaxID=129043 RepID=UPI002AD201A3|nr:DELTA-sagatoxin-Srs1a-like [Cololabis saira]
MYGAAPHVEVPSRQCLVEIQNKSSCCSLTDPRVHLVSGSSEAPLPPMLKPSEAGSARFVKSVGARGSVGVFTYDLVHQSSKQHGGKMAVMFSVPYDFNLYSNWYAVGMFGGDQPCDKDLYELMYKGGEKGFVRGKAKGPGLTHRMDRVTVRATMSDSYRPVLKVDVCDN